MPSSLLTPRDVAVRYAVSTRAIHRWCSSGRLPYLVTPTGKRFNADELREWERRRSFNSAGEAKG